VSQQPLDVLNYQVANPDFPQQGTGDQFFDEEQWEAYRRLGENMAREVFGALKPAANHSVSAGWQMFDLDALRRDAPPAPPAANADAAERSGRGVMPGVFGRSG
jgi:hypothetical protein